MEKSNEREKEMFPLLKPFLKSADIQYIEGIGHTQASKVIELCKTKYKGGIIDKPQAITTESYMKYCGYDNYPLFIHQVIYGKLDEEVLMEAIKDAIEGKLHNRS